MANSRSLSKKVKAIVATLNIVKSSYYFVMDLESETFILLNNVKSSYYCFDLFTYICNVLLAM